MNQAQRGRILVLVVISLVLGVSLFVIVISNFVANTGNIVVQGVRFAITAVLCINLYFGKNWVRWLFVVLLAAGGVVSSAAGVSLGTANPGALLIFLMGVIYLVCAVTLALSPSIKMFLQYQRAGLILEADPENL